MPITPTENGADSSLLTLERIFTDKEFDTKGFGPYQWLADDSGYIVLETADSPSDDNNKQQNIVRYNLESGESQVLATAEQLTPEGEDKPLKVSNFHWSEETERLLLFTNTKRVWRQNTRGDYWLLDVQSGRLKQLGGEAPPSSLMFAKFSPDGRSVAYVCEKNIYVENLESGEGVRGQITQLTTDGSQTITNGTADWVNEEELYLRDCFLWSPDGRYIAYWQFDTSGVETFHLINNTDSQYPQLIPFPYPKVGSVNSAVRVGVVPAEGGETTWFDIEGDPREHYIHKMVWAKDSAAVVLQQVDRYQHCNKVLFGDVEDGSVEVVLTEEDETWVDLHDGLHLLADGRSFTWLRDRDGWRHIYLVSGDGREMQLLTPGEFDVIEIAGIDEADGLVYFIASPENFTQRYLYQAALDGSGQVKRVTPTDQPGTHSYEMSPKGTLALQTYDAFCLPPVTALLSLPAHKQLKMVEGNETVHEKVAALNHPAVEFFKVKIAEDIVLDGWGMKPPDFDPNQQYPLLLHIYGEPSGLTVKDLWSGSKHIWHWYLAKQGFIVMSIDGHGTPQPRGRSWRKSMYKQVGTKSAADQAAALKVILAERPYIDPERVGIWGWSGGGTMTLNMLFRYPELYKTGVAIAAVCDQRLYDTIYQERYMGPLSENEEAYVEGSPITHAHKLEGNLLLIHGTADDNVHYQCFERLVNELIKHNKQFSTMVYPNRTHAIKEGKNTSLHLHTLMTRYLVDHLL